jgi:hypothetical protein
MAEQAHATRNGLLCSLAFLACALIADPFVQMGYMDDWSYIWSAREFAQTGHFAYVWSSPILGWQLVWGALFIKLFGFSFITVRISALPIAMLTVLLFHAILVRFGITPRNAVIGTLTFALSPLFLPIATSFMTDTPGLCSILLCIYLCQRAVAAQTSKSSVVWLILAAFTNLLSGTVRQTSWLGLLVIVPSTAIFLRNRKGVLLTAGVSWLVGCAFIAACLHWFNLQPGSLHEHVFHGQFKDPAHPSIYLMLQLLGSALLILLLLYPLIGPWLKQVNHMGKIAWVRVLGITTLLSLLQWKIRWTLPWLFYVVVLDFDNSRTGPVLGKDRLTFPLPIWLRISIGALVIFTALLVVEHVFARRGKISEITKSSGPSHSGDLLWIAGPYALCYALLLIPRGLYNFISDRYLLGLLPIIIIAVIKLYQRSVGPRLPLASLVLMLCFAFLAIGSTHDWFAGYRARLIAIHALRSSGIPRAQIQGGFEYDSWTRVEDLHYGYKPLKLPSSTTEQCATEFAPMGPPVDRKFTVIYADEPCVAPSRFPPVSYRAWLPPFQRRILVETFTYGSASSRSAH